MKPTLGFVGLGNMGLPLCRRLINHGYSIFLYDVNPVAFVPFEGTSAQPITSLLHLARQVEIILLSLPNSSVVEHVILGEEGLSAGLSAGQIIIDLSSSRPSSTQYLATMLARQHVHLLDAPISGGVQRAREGTLAILVGGEHEVFEQQVPLLQTFGAQIFYMGEHGSGHLAKALNNLLSATSLASAIEAVLVGSRYGLDPSKFIAAVNASTGRSNSTEVKFPQFILPETFTDGFALSLMNKDIHIALGAAAEMDIPTRIGLCVGTVWQEAEEQGFGSTGHTTLYTFLKDRLDQHESEKNVRHDERGVSSMLNEQNASPEQQDNKESEKNMEIRVEQQDYIDEMVRKRGYVLDYHKVLTRQDFPVMQAADNLVHAAYLKERLLDRKTKELIFITSLTVMRSEKAHIQSHIRVALQLGLSAEEILEAIEITLPEAGVVAFQWGFDAWREVVHAQGIEPSKETTG